MKTVFNCILQTGDGTKGNKGFITYHKVANIDKFKVFIKEKFPNWTFFHVYNHATRKHIETIKKA